jgi:hypothetical protein
MLIMPRRIRKAECAAVLRGGLKVKPRISFLMIDVTRFFEKQKIGTPLAIMRSAPAMLERSAVASEN